MQNTQQPKQFKFSPGMAFAITGIAGLVFLAIVVAILLNETTAGLFCSVFWAVIFLPLLYRTGKRAFTAGRVGLPEITLSSSILRSGENLVISYQHAFKNAAELTQITIQLLLQESATRGSGTDRTTKRHEFLILEMVVPGRHVEGGETFYTRQNLEIPPGAMHSFKTSDNSLTWMLKIKVHFQGLPDLEEKRPIQIAPQMANY